LFQNINKLFISKITNTVFAESLGSVYSSFCIDCVIKSDGIKITRKVSNMEIVYSCLYGSIGLVKKHL